MDHLEAIVELKNIVNLDFCKNIKALTDKKSIKNLTIEGGKINKNIRNVKGYSLDLKTPTNLFYWNYIKREIERLYLHYKIKFPKMGSNIINQIDLLKKNGINNFLFLINNFEKEIREFLKNNYLDKFKINKDQIFFGTAGSLYDAREKLEDRFLIIYEMNINVT